MIKKISYSVLIAILAAIAGASVVLAENPSSPKHAPDSKRALVGQVLAVSAEQLQVESPNGESHSIALTAETIFRSRQGEPGEPASFSDLEVGMWVAVFQKGDSRGSSSAHLVVLLPADFDPSSRRGKCTLGEIEKINPGQLTFQLLSRSGERITLQVDEGTRFTGGVHSFDELEKGMRVAVCAVTSEDNTLLARWVAAKSENGSGLQKTGGKISQVGDSSITILNRQGDEQTFVITEATRFGSRQGEIHGLEDLETGLVVVILHQPQQDQAVAVLVADQALLKTQRMRGSVQSAGGKHLTIIVGDEKLEFEVDDHTRIRGHGIQDLNDLKNGMQVLVFYIESEDSWLAKGILALPSRTP
ncbi:MAG TPA: hypothetical protein DCY42_08410 [Chloroflexi bacterium]|nr:hypothetical protein [Chloroflexota bacterium]